jgi:hypothetical protein
MREGIVFNVSGQSLRKRISSLKHRAFVDRRLSGLSRPECVEGVAAGRPRK